MFPGLKFVREHRLKTNPIFSYCATLVNAPNGRSGTPYSIMMLPQSNIRSRTLLHTKLLGNLAACLVLDLWNWYDVAMAVRSSLTDPRNGEQVLRI